jgi:hypothetical protein
VEDRFSAHTADLILVDTPPSRNRGTVQGVKAYFQSPESLILAKLRMVKATVPRERSLKDRDDIRAILANTRVSKKKILDRARKEGTIEIFREILTSTQSELLAFPALPKQRTRSKNRARPHLKESEDTQRDGES